MKHSTLIKIFTMALLTTLPIGKMWAETSSTSDDGVSHESLLKGYVQQMLDEALPSSKRTTAATRRSAAAQLTGNELALYNKLVPFMKDVAAGTITNTEIAIPVADIFGQKSWTAADLGVDEIVKDGSVTPEASAAFNAKISINISLVVDALLSDLPYDLFWYDKAKGYSYNWFNPFFNSSSFYYADGGDFFTYKFAVAKEYSATNAIGTYDVMPNITTSVQTAITNAQAIVAANSAKPLYAKLDAYRQAICDMVSYNYPAANDDTTPFGNPWQLVWVFDGNPETKVVCEGYSKAFKYLCDLSSLESGVECLLVTGYMATSNGGGGGHMWNIMKMDDGKSYLVDVTNCDGSNEGYTIGYPNKLFMASGFSYDYDETNKLWYYQKSWSYSTVRYYYNELPFTESDLTISSTAYDAGNVHIFETMDIPYQLNNYKGQNISLKFTRTDLTAAKPVTICLPFDYTPKATDGKFYAFTGVSKVDGKWQATMTEYTGATLTANTPYLFEPSGTSVDFGGTYTIPTSLEATSATNGDWTFKGTYEKKVWDSGSVGNDYGFAATSGTGIGGETVNAGDFVRAAAGASIEPMRSYLTYTPSGARTFTRGDEELPDRISVVLVSKAGTTTIGTIDTRTGEFSDNVWFDLNGRQLDSKPTQNGIYINSKGQKVLVK